MSAQPVARPCAGRRAAWFAAGSLLASNIALAQDDGASVAVKPGPETYNDAPTELETVVVTATKTKRDAQTVPVWTNFSIP